MKKAEEQELMKLLVDGLKGSVDNQKEFTDLLDRIIGLIEFLMKSVTVIIFVLTGVVLKVFFWKPLNDILDKVSDRWASLSEGYQILILGFIGAIIAGIIANVAGSLLLARIKTAMKRE
jgi:preprotein translocase subunit YajC